MGDGEPLISVVLPVYNVERFLKRCVNSVRNQDYKNLEILLVDDGSTDNSGILCDDFAREDQRIFVIHKANGGPSDARNCGIAQAKGKYITFIDSDDEVDLDYVSYLYSLIIKFKCKMSLCSHRILYEKSGKIINLGNKTETVLSAKNCIEKMCYHDLVDTSAWGKLYETSLFHDVTYPDRKKFEDMGTTYKLFINSERIACGFNSKYTYHIRDNSITTSDFSLSKLDLLEMTDCMARDVIYRYPELRQAVLRRQVYARFSTLNQMLNVDDKTANSIKEEIVKYIKMHSNEVLRDTFAPRRDKIAVLSLMVGISFYRILWSAYKAMHDSL